MLVRKNVSTVDAYVNLFGLDVLMCVGMWVDPDAVLMVVHLQTGVLLHLLDIHDCYLQQHPALVGALEGDLTQITRGSAR